MPDINCNEVEDSEINEAGSEDNNELSQSNSEEADSDFYGEPELINRKLIERSFTNLGLYFKSS